MKYLFLLTLSVIICINIFSQTNTLQKNIQVSGTAELEIIPDEIYVTVELREYDKKGVGKIDIDKIKNNFLTNCKNIGLTDKEISIQNYQGWDNNYWWYRKNKNKNPDMNASITYQIKFSDTKKMDELVKLLDDEATNNFTVSKVAHSNIENFKKQLKILAVKAAKEKAIYLAEAIGEKVGEAITINEPIEYNNYNQNRYANVMMKSESADGSNAPMDIDFKKIKLKFEVTVNFALK